MTRHFKIELNKLNKHTKFVLDVLCFGKHYLISKRKNKYNVYYPFRKKFICISYIQLDRIILIHIAPIKKLRFKENEKIFR